MVETRDPHILFFLWRMHGDIRRCHHSARSSCEWYGHHWNYYSKYCNTIAAMWVFTWYSDWRGHFWWAFYQVTVADPALRLLRGNGDIIVQRMVHAYILSLLGYVIVPDKSDLEVHGKYLQLFEHMEQLELYSWGLAMPRRALLGIRSCFVCNNTWHLW